MAFGMLVAVLSGRPIRPWLPEPVMVGITGEMCWLLSGLAHLGSHAAQAFR